MNYQARDFLLYGHPKYGVDILKKFINHERYDIALETAEYLVNIFPENVDITFYYAICLYKTNHIHEAFKLWDKIICQAGISKSMNDQCNAFRHLCISNICNLFINYDRQKIDEITKYVRDPQIIKTQIVTLTITSCKRLQLFVYTINSFIKCCTDWKLIGQWLCIDDNSSNEDRQQMLNLYPFFDFIFKTPTDAGHAQSMNCILNHVKTPYILHLEDDWLFFSEKNYIGDSLNIIASDENIGQCLFNVGYAESPEDFDIGGGIQKLSPEGIRYYIHDHITDIAQFYKKYGQIRNCAYWPHFSLRPSVTRMDVLHYIGNFDEKVDHFEMDYAHRYVEHRYISAYLSTIHCIHLGKTTRKDDRRLNAYALNNQFQFIKNLNIPILGYVLNLDSRQDRLMKVSNEIIREEIGNKLDISIQRFPAIEGKKLKHSHRLQHLFNNNDYEWNSTAIGCGLSHIKMWINLSNSDKYKALLIFEDDIKLVPNFTHRFMHVYSQIIDQKWDIVYLGHGERNLTPNTYNTQILPIVEKFDTKGAIQKSLGGTVAYLISKDGAKKMLKFINKIGMINCIDTMQQRAADTLDVWYCTPQIVMAEFYRGNPNIDSDIQFNRHSIAASDETELIWSERNFYIMHNIRFIEIASHNEDNDKIWKKLLEHSVVLFKNQVVDPEILKLPYYIVGKFRVVTKNHMIALKYFQRLVLDGKFYIDDIFDKKI